MNVAAWLLESGDSAQTAIDVSGCSMTYSQLREAVDRRARDWNSSSRSVANVGGNGDLRWLVDYLGALAAGSTCVLNASAPLDAYGWPAGTRIVLSTSGTTGAALQVPLTAANVSANTQAIVSRLNLSPVDRILCCLPFNFAFGLSLVHSTLRVGGTLCLPEPGLGGSYLLKSVLDQSATVLPLVPATANSVRRTLRKQAAPPSLRMVQIAGGHTSAELVTELTALLPEHVEVFVMYGLTEATARVTAFNARLRRDKIGSVGNPLPGIAVHAEDDAGRRLPAGERGVLVVNSPGSCESLIRADDALVTGDVGWVDQEGFVFIDGRESSFVKVGGLRMSLTAVEDALAELPGVSHASVFGVPDSALGERVAALVVPDGKARGLSPVKLRADLAEMFDHRCVPAEIRMCAELPTTRSGKVAGSLLPEWWAAAAELPK